MTSQSDDAAKHSSGDLHSRLKTRKLLGVGETDDGDVHRSKLSQILGHSEQLYVRLPRGLRLWQFVCAAIFSVVAVWALLFPRQWLEHTLGAAAESSAVLPTRLYGAAMASFALLFWSTCRCTDKDILRWSLLSSSVLFILQTIALALGLLEAGVFLSRGPRLLGLMTSLAAVTCLYYCMLGDKIHKYIPAKPAGKERADLDEQVKDKQV